MAVIIVLAVVIGPGAIGGLFKGMLPDWGMPDISLGGGVNSSKRQPPKANVKKVELKISPTIVQPAAYVRAEISGLELTRNTKNKTFGCDGCNPDALTEVKLRGGEKYLADTLIGFVPGSTPNFYRTVTTSNRGGKNIRLILNANALVQIQPRAIPFANEGKLSCDEHRWTRNILQQGDCGYLVERVPGVAVIALNYCLREAWPQIGSAVIQAERQRINFLENYARKLLGPNERLVVPAVQISFGQERPRLGQLPGGWILSEKDGKPVITHDYRKDGKAGRFTIFLGKDMCQVDVEALKRDLTAAATQPPTPIN